MRAGPLCTGAVPLLCASCASQASLSPTAPGSVAGYRLTTTAERHTLTLCLKGTISFWDSGFTTRTPGGADANEALCSSVSALSTADIATYGHTYAPRAGEQLRVRRGVVCTAGVGMEGALHEGVRLLCSGDWAVVAALWSASSHGTSLGLKVQRRAACCWSAGMSAVIPCPAGTYPNGARDACTACGNGDYRAASMTGQDT